MHCHLCCCKNCTNVCFTDGPENVGITGPNAIYSEQTLKLTCTAESEPSATYTWTLNGTEIHSSSVFTKVNTKLSDSGNYTCQAMNHITEKTSSAVHHVTITGSCHHNYARYSHKTLQLFSLDQKEGSNIFVVLLVSTHVLMQ